MEPSDRQWQRVHRYIAAGQSAPARVALESILARDPLDTTAHVTLCGLYAASDQQRAATAQALKAALVPPSDPDLLGDLIAALLWVGEMVTARRLLDSPLIAASASPRVLMRAAGQRQALGENAAALALMKRARMAGANGRDFRFHYAVQLAFNGDMSESREELERCIEMDPPLGRAFVQLARMRKQTPQSNHLDRIETALGLVDQGGYEHAALEFAYYEELEDLHRYDAAWQALARGNAIMHKRLPHDAVREAALFGRLIETCTPEFLRAGSGKPDDSPQPIFVIGLPRSGTTVLERLLGNHSHIAPAGELGDFPRALAFATDHLAPIMFDETTLARLGAIDWNEVGQMYLEQTRWRAQGKPFYVDKLPRNWMVAGLIHLALPCAKVLHVLRDPMDVCFSNWRAYLGPGAEYAYTYDIQALAAHHHQYRRIMAHWHQASPGHILDVEYSRLVHQPEAAAREVFSFCGLPHEPGCTDLIRNTAPSATLSMSQVRQPIHTRAFKEWLPYAAQLAGLSEAITG